MAPKAPKSFYERAAAIREAGKDRDIVAGAGTAPGAVIKLALMWWIWAAFCLCDLLTLHLIEARPLQTFLAFLFTGFLTDAVHRQLVDQI